MTASEMLRESPLYRLIKEEWQKFGEELSTVRATEDDLLLYVVWTLDALRERDDESFYVRLWHTLRNLVFHHFIDNDLNQSGNDVNLLTDVTLAFALRCWGLMMSEDTDYQIIYFNTEHNLGEHERSVLGCMEKICVDDWEGLKDWLVRYAASDIYCTVAEVMEYDRDIDIESYDNLMRSACAYLPAMLPTKKVKELYLMLREGGAIEQSVTEEDMLQCFGCRVSEKELMPLKWLLKKDDLLSLLRGIYDKWQTEDKPTWGSIAQIANNIFTKNNGEKYSISMKLKPSYKGLSSVVEDFLATI